MATSVLSMVLDVKKRGTGGAEATRELQGLRGSWTELNSALNVGRQAVQMAGQAYQATVGQLLNYADQVRTLSSVTGQSAESSSRMIQVMDDFNISGDQVTTMLRMMAREGLTPNIQTMATLSDRYLALAPGVERATFLQRNFGRSGADLALVMDQGSAAILVRNAGISQMLVLDEQALADAREMELAVDDLKDAWLGIELFWAQNVIPTLADLTRGVAAVFQHEEGDNLVEWLQGIFVQGLEQSLGYVQNVGAGVSDLAGAIESVPTERHTTFYVDANITPEADWFMRHFGSYIPGAATLGPMMLGTYGGISGTAAGPGGGGAHGPPGGWAAWAAAHPGEFWGGAQGGAFDVIGPAGVDRVPVGFMATAGERVTVQTAEQQRRGGGGAGVHFHGDIHLGGDLDLAKFEKMLVRTLRG